jgi:hypothetical protein
MGPKSFGFGPTSELRSDLPPEMSEPARRDDDSRTDHNSRGRPVSGYPNATWRIIAIYPGVSRSGRRRNDYCRCRYANSNSHRNSRSRAQRARRQNHHRNCFFHFLQPPYAHIKARTLPERKRMKKLAIWRAAPLRRCISASQRWCSATRGLQLSAKPAMHVFESNVGQHPGQHPALLRALGPPGAGGLGGRRRPRACPTGSRKYETAH